jgi:hypothetical protein
VFVGIAAAQLSFIWEKQPPLFLLCSPQGVSAAGARCFGQQAAADEEAAGEGARGIENHTKRRRRTQLPAL